MKIEVGQKYKHYKTKNVYEIFAVGRSSETLEEMVVYRGLYDSLEFGNNPIWIRPKKMFCEKVKINGKEVNRFELIE